MSKFQTLADIYEAKFLTGQLLPRLVQNVVHKGLSSHGILPGVARGATEKHDLGLADDGDRVAEACLRDLTVHVESLDNARSLRRDRLARAIVSGGSLQSVAGLHHSVAGGGTCRSGRLRLLAAKCDRHLPAVARTLAFGSGACDLACRGWLLSCSGALSCALLLRFGSLHVLSSHANFFSLTLRIINYYIAA